MLIRYEQPVIDSSQALSWPNEDPYLNPPMSAAAQHGFFSRTWQRYLGALKQRPIRTKSVTSASLYVVADCIAQFGIEGRSFAPKSEEVEAWDVRRSSELM